MSANEDELDIDPEDAPEIEDKPGPWDNVLNSLILVAPWVMIIAALVYVVYTGSLSTDIVLAGEIPVRPFAYVAGGLIGITYLLALMKFYGVAPLAYIFEKAHTFAMNYNPSNNDD